jgi:hypothetical protein
MRNTAAFTLWDHKRNEEILKKFKVEPISIFFFRIIGLTGRNILKE